MYIITFTVVKAQAGIPWPKLASAESYSCRYTLHHRIRESLLWAVLSYSELYMSFTKLRLMFQLGLRDMVMECPSLDHARAIFGPCQGHVCSSFTFWLATALKFSRLCQQGLAKCIDITFFTMTGPCLDHFRALFGLSFL